MSSINFVDIGFSNYVEAGKILTVSRPDSSPIKRTIQHAKDTGNYLDLTQGKKTRSIITQKGDTGLIVTASSVQTATIIERIKRAQQVQVREFVEHVSDDIVESTISS